MLRRFRRSGARRVDRLEELVAHMDVEFIPSAAGPMAERLSVRTAPRYLDSDHRIRHEELLATKHDLLTDYIERRFLIATYLPQAFGAVLDVGAEAPNANDGRALPDPDQHWTIDVDPAVAPFGSPRHQTVDFFDFAPGILFMHIILFGLIGTPNNRTDEYAHISFDANDRLISHAAQLLDEGGRLVLGPELSAHSRAAADDDVLAWLSWFRENPVLSTGFTLEYALRGRCNLVAVLRRIGIPAAGTTTHRSTDSSLAP